MPPGNRSARRAARCWPSTAPRSVRSFRCDVLDFVVGSDSVTVLGTDQRIRRSRDLVHWRVLGLAPEGARSLALLDGRLYVGATEGAAVRVRKRTVTQDAGRRLAPTGGPATLVDLDARLRPRPDMVVRQVGDWSMLIDVDTGFTYETNRLGTLVWQLLGQAVSLAAGVLPTWPRPTRCRPTTVAGDVLAFTRDLVRFGLCSVDQADMKLGRPRSAGRGNRGRRWLPAAGVAASAGHRPIWSHRVVTPWRPSPTAGCCSTRRPGDCTSSIPPAW